MGFVGSAVNSIAKAFTPQNDTQGANLAGTGSYTQQQFLDAIKQAQNQYQGVTTGENALAGQLQAQANGQGPSLAAGQLMQGTNANIAKTASMIASQKGISPALAARQAADTAASSNQAAAGQSAQLKSQEQLNAQSGLSNLYGTEGNQAISQQGMLQGAQSGQNAQLVNQSLGVQGISANAAAQNTQNTNATTQGIFGSAGKALALAGGGEVHPFHAHLARLFADGGMVDPISGGVQVPGSNPFPWMTLSSNKDSGSNFFGVSGKKAAPADPMAGASQIASNGASDLGGAGGTLEGVNGIVSSLGPLAIAADEGAEVPGDGMVNGDSPKNDTVPALLSPKEIVLPRSVTMSDDAPEKAMEFVEAIKGKSKKGYGSVIEARRHFEEGMKHLKALKGA